MSAELGRTPANGGTSGDERRSPRVLIVAGEASGDLHGAHLMEEIRTLEGSVHFCGLGGERMKARGMESVADSRDIAVVGLVEVLKVLPRAKRIFDGLLELARDRRPDLAVLIDAPDFNLRLARRLAGTGVPVVYYVSPQIWAWRRQRVRKMRGIIERMLVLFPFEEEFYREAGVDVVHVGHPLLDVVPAPRPEDASAVDERADERPDEWIVGLLPGSRDGEVDRILPGMLEAAAILERRTGTRTRLLRAGGVSHELVDRLLARSPVEVEVVDAREDRSRFFAIRECRLVLCASGTATLEVGLLGVPMVVCYRMAAFSHAIARRLVQVEHIALVNLVLGRRLVPEQVQGDAEPRVVAEKAMGLLVDGEARERVLEGLEELREALGAEGASRRAAEAVLEVLHRVRSRSAGAGGNA